MSVADLKRYLRVIATALHAPGWCVQQTALSIGEPLINWRWSLCDELSHMETDCAATKLDESPTWRPELLLGALSDQFGTQADGLRESQADSDKDCCGICWPPAAVIDHGREHLLGWATMGDDDICCCFVFMRSLAADSFTAHDASVLAVLGEELLRSAYAIEATANACPRPELSPRQHDVLERLLQGLTVKEVARDLRLSPHTVNDYVRALYKRFNVSSRGELMAVVHGHRKPLLQ